MTEVDLKNKPETTSVGTDQVSDAAADESSDVNVQAPEFAALQPDDSPRAAGDIGRFQDVKLTVSAELGKAKISVQKLMQLGVGSVVELNRPINSPVELVADGIPLAQGEVVVVDDCFAIRIKHVYDSQVKSMKGNDG